MLTANDVAKLWGTTLTGDSYKYLENRPSYRQLVESMGEVLVEEVEDNWQGYSLFLLKLGNQFGVLKFGWGSCSGCDALEAADTLEDIAKLHDELDSSIQWASKEDTAKYLKEHDWKGDWTIEGLYVPFVQKSLEVLAS